jgi:hypothetical protein
VLRILVAAAAVRAGRRGRRRCPALEVLRIDGSLYSAPS